MTDNKSNNIKHEWLNANTISFEDHLTEQLQDPEYQKMWLEASLQEFIEEGDIDMFVKTLTRVVKARGRGEITRLASQLGIDRSNLSEIINGKRKPLLSTALKLVSGLGYKCDIKLESA